MTPWGDHWLVQLNGGILNGICFDKERDKTVYKPTFFMHNILDPFDCISLSYNAPLHNKKGIGISLRYDRFDENDIKTMKEQIRGLREPISFEVF